jgi:hypothetical protein
VAAAGARGAKVASDGLPNMGTREGALEREKILQRAESMLKLWNAIDGYFKLIAQIQYTYVIMYIKNCSTIPQARQGRLLLLGLEL